jgi:hypothetical protein
VRSTVFLLHLHFLSMKNVHDGVRHALRHGVVSLKSSFFVGLIIIGRLNNTIILLIFLLLKYRRYSYQSVLLFIFDLILTCNQLLINLYILVNQ